MPPSTVAGPSHSAATKSHWRNQPAFGFGSAPRFGKSSGSETQAGPGAYDVAPPHSGNSYRRRVPSFSFGGRPTHGGTFQITDSPGPQAYTPRVESTKPTPRGAVVTGRVPGLPVPDVPGPGTYQAEGPKSARGGAIVGQQPRFQPPLIKESVRQSEYVTMAPGIHLATPGPKYDLPSTFDKEGRGGYTIAHKAPLPPGDHERNPGPADYAPRPHDSSRRWSMTKEPRGAIYKVPETPGPGAYEAPKAIGAPADVISPRRGVSRVNSQTLSAQAPSRTRTPEAGGRPGAAAGDAEAAPSAPQE
eukprot:tig00020556_g11041.t1